jgi:sterol desaturase/sphingolipid hydroxylase (fatty acid hydroxylase superfamily)
VTPVLLAIAGYRAWPAVEYLIHGVLAHRFRTFVSPLHWSHHQDPHRVFTSPTAWVPASALIYALLGLAVGWAPAAALTGGVLAGFLRYEYVHWRIHFRAPRTARQQLLRGHHLAHHFRNPRAYHGVTSRLWDRLGGTLPPEHEADYGAVAGVRVLDGSSNLGALAPRWRQPPA